MKAIIVTCYESNEERVTIIMDACLNYGFNTIILTTNYSHFRKEYRNNIPNDFTSIPTKPYKSNLSIARLWSHHKFAKDAFKIIEEQNPDLLWVVAPCNSLIKEANKYKQTHQDKKLIIDMIDMWPESFPKGNKELLPFKLWKNIRTNNINCADELVTECNLYQEILKKEYIKKITTIHWARDNKAINSELENINDKLSLAYIGSINNIIDINLIKQLIVNTDRRVDLHIIGDGENKNNMIHTLQEVCNVYYYGKIYGIKEKEMILKKCHAGINVYKEGLYIGLTVKCIDYFMYGLPIINNIKGDTWNFVENDKVGINVNKDTRINSKELINMRINNSNIINLYNKNFTKNVFINKCLKVIERVIK